MPNEFDKTDTDCKPSIQSVPDLINKITSEIHGQEDADDSLLEILKKHLLREAVETDCVNASILDIEELAKSRVLATEASKEQKNADDN